MRILFMETYYPGIFRFLVPFVTQYLTTVNGSHEVFFLSKYKRKEYELPNINHIQLDYPRASSDLTDSEQVAINSLYQLEAFSHALEQFKKSGLEPDIIISTEPCCGRVLEIFPNTLSVCYFDKYHDNKTEDLLENNKTKSLHYLRNPYQLLSLLNSHYGIASTDLQKSSFPQVFHKKLHTLPMGIDTTFFHPADVKNSENPELREHVTKALKAKELITWSLKMPDQYFAFETIAKALPQVFAARTDCQLVLLTPHPDKIKKNPHIASLLTSVPNRVHVFKDCTYEEYRAILQASSVHLYYTITTSLPAPLLEAMSCGCLLAGSDTPLLRSIVTHNKEGILGDYFQSITVSDNIINALRMPDKEKEKMRANARKKIEANFSTQALIPKHLEFIMDLFAEFTNEKENND